eukprot:657146-Hanusia_phi.AAC.2
MGEPGAEQRSRSHLCVRSGPAAVAAAVAAAATIPPGRPVYSQSALSNLGGEVDQRRKPDTFSEGF